MDRKQLLNNVKKELKELQQLIDDLKKEPNDFDLWLYVEDCEAIGSNLIGLKRTFEKSQNE